MYETTKLSRANKEVKALLKATFPEYRGRTISMVVCDKPLDVTSYWSGGTRSRFKAIELGTMRCMAVPQNGTPFDGGPVAPNGVVIPAGFAIVEHQIFCGSDVGISIHVSPKGIPARLT